MVRIAGAGNVEVPAYLTLAQRGFEVRCDEGGLWHATKTDCDLIGDGCLELLGLAAMFETRGEHWRASDEEIDNFLAKFPS
jgi:hypothetical protein